MCITVWFMELWATLFARCGKGVFSFTHLVNGVVHNGMVSYAHFHDALYFTYNITRQVCCLSLAALVCFSVRFPALNIHSDFPVFGLGILSLFHSFYRWQSGYFSVW